MIKAILFDFDGVIADTFDFCFEIRKKFEPQITRKIYRKYFEGNINNQENNKFSFEERAERNKKFFELYEMELKKLDILPGMEEVISSFSGKFMLFIVSSTDSDIIRRFLLRSGLGDKFVEILGNDVDYSKVNKINRISDKYNLTPENCLFITDTLGDILEAKSCGVRSVAVIWGYHLRVTLEIGRPFKIVDSPTELAATVQIIDE